MFFTLEIQHAVRPGRERDFLVKLKELKGANGHFKNNILGDMISNYLQAQEMNSSVTKASLPDIYDWHSYLESPSHVKIRMSS